MAHGEPDDREQRAAEKTEKIKEKNEFHVPLTIRWYLNCGAALTNNKSTQVEGANKQVDTTPRVVGAVRNVSGGAESATRLWR